VEVDPEPIALDLGGLAIRGMAYDAAARQVLVIGGGTTAVGGGAFRLFEWNGSIDSTPRDRGPLRSPEKPEGITRVQAGGRARTLVVFDLGGYQWID
jgi:hypothetical protein